MSKFRFDPKAWRRRKVIANAICAIDPLERRLLLSFSAATLLAPRTVPGNQWTYSTSAAGTTPTDTFTQTVIGPAIFNGQSATEIDTVLLIGKGGGQEYYGFDGAGDYVDYGGMQIDLHQYDPYRVGFVNNMVAGVTYDFTNTDGDEGGSFGPPTEDHKLTLVSNTPAPLTVPAGTFNTIEGIDVQTTTTPNGTNTPDVRTTTSDTWYALGVGIVKISVSNGVTAVLTKYKVAGDALAFTQPPTDTAKGDTIGTITVSAKDSSGKVDTKATGSITIALNNVQGNGTLTGTLTELLVNGIATFSDLSIDDGGTYTLTATDNATPPVTSATSAQFKITVDALTWTGAGDGTNWSDAKNWDGNVAPVNGDSLDFPSGSPLASNNDIAGLSINEIDIEGAGYTLTGKGISLTGGLTSEDGNNTYNIDTKLVGSPTLDDQTGDLTIASIFSGGGLTIAGNGIVTFDQSDTYTGITTLDAGVTIDDSTLNGVFGSNSLLIKAGSKPVSIDDTASSAVTIDNDITFEDGSTLSTDPLVDLGGKITVNGQATVAPQNAGDVLTLEGATIVGTGTLNEIGDGIFQIDDDVAATVKIVVKPGAQLNLNGALDAAADAAAQVTVMGGTLKLLSGVSGSGGIDVKSGILISAGAPDYEGPITLEQPATGGTSVILTPGVDPLGLGDVTLLGPSAPSPTSIDIINQSGNEEPLRIDSFVTADGAPRIDAQGTVVFTQPLNLKSDAEMDTNVSTDVLKLNGGIAGSGTLTVDGPGLTYDQGNTTHTAIIEAGNRAGSTGELLIGSKIESSALLPNAVTVKGGTLSLLSNLSGAGGIDMRDGTLLAAGESGYNGVISLEGDSASPNVIANITPSDDALGTGQLVVTRAGGATGDVMVKINNTTADDASPQPLVLNIPLIMANDGELSVSGAVTFSKPVILSVIFISNFIQGDFISSTSSSDAVVFDGGISGIGNLTLYGSGPITVNGGISAKASVTVLDRAGEANVSIGGVVSGDIEAEGGTLQLLAGMSGSGSIFVDSHGTVLTDKTPGAGGYPNYTGKVEDAGIIQVYDSTDSYGLGAGPLEIDTAFSSAEQIVNAAGVPITLSNPTVTVTAGRIGLSDGQRIKLTGNLILTRSDGALIVNGTLALTGGIQGIGAIVLNSGDLQVAGSNPNYSGNITLLSGFIEVTPSSDPLGTGLMTATLKPKGFVHEVNGIADPLMDNPLSVTSGTLVLQGSFTFPHGVTVSPGATLEIDNASQLVISGPLSGGGNIDLVGAAQLSVTGDRSAFTGKINNGVTPTPTPTPTPTATTIPDGPYGLTALPVSATEINLFWDTTKTNNETSFTLERSINGGAFVAIATVPAGTTSYQNTQLTAATSYQYRVQALNSRGHSGYSNIASASTLPTGSAPIPVPAVRPTTVPNGPYALTVTPISATQLDLNWHNSANNEAGYTVERSGTAGNWTVIAILPAGSASYSDASLTASTQFSYRVRAYNAFGTSSYTGPVSGFTLPSGFAARTPTPQAPAPTTVPNGPFALSAKSSSTKDIKLNWFDVPSNEAGYIVERQTNGGAFQAIANLPVGSTLFDDNSVLAASTYRYRVFAYNAYGDSSVAGPVGVGV